MLEGKKILLAVTGSIAAYKSALLVRLLVRQGAEVKVLMTPAAKDFITSLTLSTLSKSPVISELFTDGDWANHVMLGRWADVMVVAPLSCNTLAKMANGLCDNAVLATYLSATCPVVLAPAMDEDMWKHPVTKTNLDLLAGAGNFIIPVNHGELASGLVGDGRMAEPEAIVEYLESQFFSAKPLAGKHALVTAGPTYEAIDPVRFIGNRSSGKMGFAIARELWRSGASVTLVSGPVTLSDPFPEGRLVRVETAAEMYSVSMDVFRGSDIAVMSAAVADYSPAVVADEKIKKTDGDLSLTLKKTKDILAELGRNKAPHQFLAGFALETQNESYNARAKLASKNADMIILNSLRDEGAGFGHDTNKVTIFDKTGGETAFENKPKQQVARDIVDTMIKLMNA